MYKGGEFKFTFTINSNYPHDPPKVKCIPKVRLLPPSCCSARLSLTSFVPPPSHYPPTRPIPCLRLSPPFSRLPTSSTSPDETRAPRRSTTPTLTSKETCA